MNEKEIDKLKNEIKKFENQNIYIELEDSLQYHTTIHNAKILVSNEKLFITNEKEQDFIVELHYLDSVDISDENTIYLQMANSLKITLDC